MKISIDTEPRLKLSNLSQGDIFKFDPDGKIYMLMDRVSLPITFVDRFAYLCLSTGQFCANTPDYSVHYVGRLNFE